jgi:solute carrier family 25 phosphate transporter 3
LISSTFVPLAVPYTITKNVSFDFITTAAYMSVKGWGMAIDANMKLLIPLVSAFAASVLSTVTSQPGDMLLSAVNAHEGDRTVWDFSREIREKEGLKGYFRGMRARFLHVGLIVTVQLLIYDIVKRLVGIAATGST